MFSRNLPRRKGKLIMLNIYYGAEKTDKEKFIFDNIKGRTLLLVPDQFSLQAERDAFFYLNKESLIDLRIVDFSTLGHKAVKEVGGKKPELIDKYGSQMLLTRVLEQVDQQLKIYKGFTWKTSFIEEIYTAISDMKRYGVSADDISQVIDELDENSYLKYKMEDIRTVFEAYQEAISGKYLDTEDYILFYGEKILKAPMVRESHVWIYGFDTFTPKNILIIERLAKAAKSVNIVMTYEEDNEIFSLTKYVIESIKSMAEDINVDVSVAEIKGEVRTTALDRVKTAKDAETFEALDAAEAFDAVLEAPITLVEASNIHAEAERAAAYISQLVREYNYRYGDIVIVCNDMEGRGGTLKRTFKRWGIPIFMDKKRRVMHHPAVSCMLAVMEIVSKGYKTESVMKMIKSGMMDFSIEECEILENYVSQFKIKGNQWKNDFTKLGKNYSDEELASLNSLRAVVCDIVENARDAIGKYNTATEKTRGLYYFLENDFSMKERIERLINAQEAAGLNEGAAETAQSWNVICGILDQIVEIIGDKRISNEDLYKLMIIGLEQVEIGLVPVSSDCVIMGTLQRTRLSRVKVLLIVGANAGVLPMEGFEEGLLSDREKGILESHNLEVSKREGVTRNEEDLAVYRTINLPEERLYVSCSMMGSDGQMQRPSDVFEYVKRQAETKFNLNILGDLDGSKNIYDMVGCRESTIPYITDAVRGFAEGKAIANEWLNIIKWYEHNHPEIIDKMKAGLLFDNSLNEIGETFADELYRGDRENIIASASRLEKFVNCPFAHFVKYGLRVEAPFMYEMGSKEIGDIYHYCLMTLSEKLTSATESKSGETGLSINHPSSLWMSIKEEECRQEIKNIIENDMADFKESIFHLSKAEEYRKDRIIEICQDAAWSMIKQVRKGQIKAMYFEEGFGKGQRFEPIRVDVGGKEVLIQGIIDRLDVLENDGIRVVDYKTGSDTIDIEYIRAGYKLQLMIYLKTAVESSKSQPAGVFYFKIDDLETDAEKSVVSGEAKNIEKRLDEAYRMIGIVLDDAALIESMDGELGKDGNEISSVLPVKIAGKNKSLKAASGGYLLTEDEFDELMCEVDGQVKRICREIASGVIEVKPKRERKQVMGEYKSACKYCDYKSICMFDTSFEGCKYDYI